MKEIYIDTTHEEITVFASGEFIRIPFDKHAYSMLKNILEFVIKMFGYNKIYVDTMGNGIAVFDYLSNIGFCVEDKRPLPELHRILKGVEKQVKGTDMAKIRVINGVATNKVCICGKENSLEAKFCMQCGGRFEINKSELLDLLHASSKGVNFQSPSIADIGLLKSTLDEAIKYLKRT